jgi:hypothetical protein
MAKSSHLLLAAVLATLLLSFGAAAEEISSAYTTLKPKACQHVTPPEAREYGSLFKCKGYDGINVRVAESDLRMFVSYGPDAETQTAATETLPQFNTIGDTLDGGSPMENRLPRSCASAGIPITGKAPRSSSPSSERRTPATLRM